MSPRIQAISSSPSSFFLGGGGVSLKGNCCERTISTPGEGTGCQHTLIVRACTASVCKFSNSISALLLGGSAKAGSTLTNFGIQKFSTVQL